MRHLCKLLVIGVLTVSASNAFGGGLPENTSNASGTSASASTTISTNTSDAVSAATNTSASTSQQTSSSSKNNGTGFIAIEDDPLIVDASAIMDDDGMGSVQVQWQISSDGNAWMNLTGAVQQSFTPREVHVGHQLRVQISYVDGQGNLETLVSPPSTPVQNVNDKPTGAPRLTGEAREEGALVVDTSLIADEDGIASLTIGWESSEDGRNWRAIETSGASRFGLTQSMVGKQVRARVSVVDSFGVETIIFSQATNTVKNVNNAPAGTIFVRRVGS